MLQVQLDRVFDSQVAMHALTNTLRNSYHFLFLLVVGLPNVGKSTLTNLLAGANHAEAANYVSVLSKGEKNASACSRHMPL